MDRKIRIGDRVRIVNLLVNHKMPVGIVERINGSYIYVQTPMKGVVKEDRCIFETYANELVKITKQEYFKLLLAGTNLE